MRPSPVTSHPAPILGPDETADAALGGAVRLIQPRRGYRFSLDAVLLARFAAERPVRRAADLGAGCGVVSLCLLALGGAEEVVGVELQPDMVDRAVRSAAWNGQAGRARFLCGDLRRAAELLPPQSRELVVANPPYRPRGRGKESPHAGAALARHEVACTAADVAAAAAHVLGSRGELCVVYPATRLAALLEACRERQLEPKELWPVHPEPGKPASLVLLRSVKGAGEGLTLRSPLFLHAAGAKYSEEAQALLGPP